MEPIFISYTQNDSKVAHLIADELARWGIVPSIDERLDSLRNWPPSIQESIKGCAVLVLIMSPESRKSDWVQQEIEYAKSLRKPIYPILVRGEAWGSFITSTLLDIRNGKLPDRSYYQIIEQAIKKPGQPTVTSSPTTPKTKLLEQSKPERRPIPYQNVFDTLVMLKKKGRGRWRLGGYIIEASSTKLTIRLADDVVTLSGGKAIPPSEKSKALGQSQPVTVTYEQSSSEYRAGYKITVYQASKYMDTAIEIIKLYQASGLNPNDLITEPTLLP